MRSQLSRLVRSSAVLLSALCASCALPSLDVTPRYGLMSLDGTFGASSSGVTATASLEEAGLDDDEGQPGLRADFKWGLPHLVVSTDSASYQGKGVLDQTIELGGTTINQGTPVTSELDIAMHSAMLMFDLLPGKTFEAGAGLGVMLIDFKIDFDGGTDSITADESIPIPLLAVNAGIHLFNFEVAAVISGMSLTVDGNKGTFIDADIFARYKILGGKNHVRSSIILGWRQTDLDVEYDDGGDEVEFDVSFSGPYLGIEITL